jgi:hypothetical protein
MMSRHMARFLLSESEPVLSDAEKQLALLADPRFVRLHGAILASAGGGGGGEGIPELYDEVTVRAARLAGLRDGEREAAYREIRERIAAATGISAGRFLPGTAAPTPAGAEHTTEER